MEKLNFIPLIGFLSLILAITSCKKEEDSKALNQFTFNAEIFDLDKGFIQDFGGNGNGSFNFIITLISSTINHNDASGGFNGMGHVIRLDMNTSSASGLVSGTYNFIASRDAFTFVGSHVATHYDVVTNIGKFYPMSGGTIDIKVDGNETTIVFNLTVANFFVNKVEGSFKGNLRKI